MEVSLFEALAEWMSQPAYYTRHGGTQPPRIGTQHATIAPYGAFTAADGKDVLPGFTFRVTDDPQRMPYFQRLRGRIVDGVVVTDPVEVLEFDKGRDTTRLFDGRMRLEMKPDRTLKRVIGGC